MNQDNILAIDPATRCGWATGDTWGVWNLRLRKDESPGMKWLRFKGYLAEMCALRPINVIGFERPAGRHANAVIHHAKLVAIIEEFCAEQGIDHIGFSAGDIKKVATGKGNSGKPAVIESARVILGYDGNDDNEADALWLLQCIKRELSLPFFSWED